MRYLDTRLVLAMHAELMAEYGGSPGVRDEGLLESALARPRNLPVYEDPSIIRLAASYASAVTGNHPFVDGNKPVAFVCMAVFLELNGLTLSVSQIEATEAMLRLAASEMAEEELVPWLERNAISAEDTGTDVP